MGEFDTSLLGKFLVLLGLCYEEVTSASYIEHSFHIINKGYRNTRAKGSADASPTANFMASLAWAGVLPSGL